ncbi:hypothetical protein [Streptomyces geranii]|uniref:hypothetical protein n=1 Tax=Streptomyces geranii TaxID=2058923 RepID=UPI0018E5A4A1|nr:hypothetical protein [Streptomyces geranii]
MKTAMTVPSTGQRTGRRGSAVRMTSGPGPASGPGPVSGPSSVSGLGPAIGLGSGTALDPVSDRARRVASLRTVVGVRGRIVSGASRCAAAVVVDADVELVADRVRRVVALRSLVGASGRSPRAARSAA